MAKLAQPGNQEKRKSQPVQIDAQKSNIEKFESTHCMKSKFERTASCLHKCY